jgi:hypothetical protein
MSKILASIKSNLRFSVEYSTAELNPEVEMIILCWKPSYKANSKGDVKKESGLEEIRFELSPKALNQLIAELQMTATELQKFEQAGEALNSVIRTMKVEKGGGS